MRPERIKPRHPRIAARWATAALIAAAFAITGGLSISTAQAAGAAHGGGVEELPDHDAAGAGGEEYAFRGVELGEFRVRAYYPVEARKSTAEFTIYANVARGDAADFRRLLKHRRQKVRDQIIIVTRLVSLADYDDPELASFRRRILLRLRRALPELEIEDVYISDFQLNVQSVAP